MPMTHGCTEHLTFEGNQKVTLTGNCLSTLVRLFLFKYRTIKHLEISSFFELESSESTVCELLVLLLRGMNHIVLQKFSPTQRNVQAFGRLVQKSCIFRQQPDRQRTKHLLHKPICLIIKSSRVGVAEGHKQPRAFWEAENIIIPTSSLSDWRLRTCWRLRTLSSLNLPHFPVHKRDLAVVLQRG